MHNIQLANQTSINISPRTLCITQLQHPHHVHQPSSHRALLQTKYLLSDDEIGPNISKFGIIISSMRNRQYKQI